MDHKKQMLQLLIEQSNIYENHCEPCQVKRAIEEAGHGKRNIEEYCRLLCPIGKQLRAAGAKMTDINLLSKSLELTKSNMRALLEENFNNEQMAKVFNTSTATISRKKREWGLTLKNFNTGYSLEDYKQQKAQGRTDSEICAIWNVGKRTLTRWKADRWGIL